MYSVLFCEVTVETKMCKYILQNKIFRKISMSMTVFRRCHTIFDTDNVCNSVRKCV